MILIAFNMVCKSLMLFLLTSSLTEAANMANCHWQYKLQTWKSQCNQKRKVNNATGMHMHWSQLHFVFEFGQM